MQFPCILLCVVLSLVLTACPVWGKTFNRCSLAREMHRLGVPKSELPQWTCIAKHESSFRTYLINPHNKDGSSDYGVFQINDRYWCKPSNGKASHNKCGVSCKDVMKDDISEAVKCAQKVKQQQGWSAWVVWNKCNGRLPSIDDCFK